ncbi:MAG TPA: D-alanyl-D-alanine carboxypeptidase/D-alanyl-D-alanine-endopeptidase [Candidatus Koribacter sp.]|jgi:dihydroorotase/N-acyl-D-amino-acid deacylase
MKRVCSHLLSVVLLAVAAHAQAPSDIAQSIEKITSRPEFAHATFAMEFYSLKTGKVVYAFNPQKLAVPGSTTKLFTEGTALEMLGADYRFHTRIYHTGTLKSNGTLEGDIVLVASGDPNLSGRIQPDGTMAFESEDHSYGGPDSHGVGTDPLLVIHEFAQQIASKGVKRVKGRVLVDARLFPQGARELGTGVVISPISVNDNVIDVMVSAGDKEGAPAQLKITPETSYVHFVNKATTGKADSKLDFNYSDPQPGPDGSQTVTVTGNLPLGKPVGMVSYAVPDPSRFAQVVLVEALKSKSIDVKLPANDDADFKSLEASYKPENLLAEHVSPPESEEVKVTLKVSQNLHASTTPYILGALVGHATKQIEQAGFDVEHDFLEKAGLDLTAASQTDGAGGNAFFAPDFVVKYLVYMAQSKDAELFHRALPVLGRDGTLAKIETNSPAAGHVFAKTGTYLVPDLLNKNLLVTGKGLAGYMETQSGDQLAFAIYANNVSIPDDAEKAQTMVGGALGEIASAAYGSTGSETKVEAAAPPENEYDVIIKGGHVMDGAGNPWIAEDVGIKGDRIVALGKLGNAHAKRTIDATGLIVAPGFIDMLGQSEWQLLIDNRSFSKLSQGITSEITGEGQSIAPQSDKTVAQMKPLEDQFHINVDWRDLNGYFAHLEKLGTPINIGTYVGAAQVRALVVGEDDRVPTPQELDEMKQLVANAMQQGAFGMSTALIYPPGHYAKTPELIELAKVVSQYGGIYASHMRSEGTTEVKALEEAMQIGREANVPVEVFHLKVVGAARWGNMPKIVGMIQSARDAGQDVRADMYPYVAGGTALASALPPWVADGGMKKLLERLHDPAVRARITREISAGDHQDWENLYYDSGGAKGVLVAGITNKDLKQFDGKTIAQIAAIEKKKPLDALMDLVIADKGQTGALYFIANEKDLQYGLKQPWTSIGLDAGELSLDGPLFDPHQHPRAFGSMPRFLGHYVRDLHMMPMEQAIRKITSMPAQREGLQHRGLIKEGFFADITIFDPATIHDEATYENPVKPSVGVKYVFVNGQLEFTDGQVTGVKAGRPLRGPGWKEAAQ